MSEGLVLVVDDTAPQRYAVRRVLEDAGFSTAEARDGAEALALVRSLEPEIVTLDVALPDVHGVELARRLRDDPTTATIGIVQLSAVYTSAEARADGLDAGADAYLAQPFEPPVLLATVRAVLRTRRAERALLASERELEALHQQAIASEREVRGASRAKDDFLALLGHELRNPLAPIVTALELMKLSGVREGAAERAVIERQVGHLRRLVDDLLDVSRIGNGKLELRPAPVDLRDVVREALEMVGPRLASKRQAVVVSVPERPVRVLGDADRLGQVVTNLVANASKFSPDGAPIALGLTIDGDRVELVVRDQGIGIGAAALPRVFDSFVQEGRGAGAEGGLGLGLAIVRGLVEAHGGRVDAASAGAGAGSAFTVRLPALGSADAPDLA